MMKTAENSMWKKFNSDILPDNDGILVVVLCKTSTTQQALKETGNVYIYHCLDGTPSSLVKEIPESSNLG